jgi:hypothetical protein
MAKQIVNIGTPDKGNGDPLRTAFGKINDNFTELYNALGIDGTVFDPLNIDSNLIPAEDSTYDIGSPTKQWRSLYVGLNTLYINNVPISLDEGGNLTVGGDPVTGDQVLEIDGGNASTDYTAEITVDGGGA